MRIPQLLTAALFAAALVAAPALVLAQDEAAKPAAADKAAAEKAAADKNPPAESTTQGTVEVGGQKIAYTAVIGTITVGATDTEDAQLGLDGKPLTGSQLALSEPKEPKDGPAIARMSYIAYFKTGAKADERPVTFFYNGGPGSSSVWRHSVWGWR